MTNRHIWAAALSLGILIFGLAALRDMRVNGDRTGFLSAVRQARYVEWSRRDEGGLSTVGEPVANDGELMAALADAHLVRRPREPEQPRFWHLDLRQSASPDSPGVSGAFDPETGLLMHKTSDGWVSVRLGAGASGALEHITEPGYVIRHADYLVCATPDRQFGIRKHSAPAAVRALLSTRWAYSPNHVRYAEDRYLYAEHGADMFHWKVTDDHMGIEVETHPGAYVPFVEPPTPEGRAALKALVDHGLR